MARRAIASRIQSLQPMGENQPKRQFASQVEPWIYNRMPANAYVSRCPLCVSFLNLTLLRFLADFALEPLCRERTAGVSLGCSMSFSTGRGYTSSTWRPKRSRTRGGASTSSTRRGSSGTRSLSPSPFAFSDQEIRAALSRVKLAVWTQGNTAVKTLAIDHITTGITEVLPIVVAASGASCLAALGMRWRKIDFRKQKAQKRVRHRTRPRRGTA